MQAVIQGSDDNAKIAQVLALAFVDGVLKGTKQPIQDISHPHIVHWATRDSRVEKFVVLEALRDDAWTPKFIHETGLTFEVWKNEWANHQGIAQSDAYLAILEERQEALKKRSITQGTTSHHGKILLLALSIIIAIGAYASCRDFL